MSTPQMERITRAVQLSGKVVSWYWIPRYTVVFFHGGHSMSLFPGCVTIKEMADQIKKVF
jgi:late competence protein required for DNA uptake (superfamily II DNA/RNA helicase)